MSGTRLLPMGLSSRSVIWKRFAATSSKTAQTAEQLISEAAAPAASRADGSEQRRQPSHKPKTEVNKEEMLTEFRHYYPDFLPSRLYNRRNWLLEKLERTDMLRRRMHLEVPEFYVGSILAVTLSDCYTPSRTNRFVGLCIRRDKVGLRHLFVLRNCIDGLGVEVQYDVYNPLIRKIEVLLLEKRLDKELRYLRDALPEYSTIPFDMEPVPHSRGTPVPVNTSKVKLQDPPWSERWDIADYKGIEEGIWTQVTPYFKRKFARKAPLVSTDKYDIVAQYRDEIPREDQRLIIDDIVQFENDLSPTSKRRPVFNRKAKLS